jgi:hypothetical protein
MLQISFFYVKTADDKLSTMDGDNRLKITKYQRCAYVDVDTENILFLTCRMRADSVCSHPAYSTAVYRE